MDADFVQPEMFSGKRWYRPARVGSAWFYHRPEAQRPASFMCKYDTVDPPIRRLVAALHAHGIPTQPSCAGHWPDSDWTQRCFRDLVSDAEQIRTRGLEFIDVESGHRVQYRNVFYAIPWPNVKAFSVTLQRFNGLGYLAFVPPPNNFIWSNIVALNSIPHVRACLTGVGGKRGIEIRVRAPNAKTQSSCWETVRKTLHV